MSDEQELVSRALSGDRAAFRTIFMTHRLQVTRLVARLVPYNDIEDVVQDVFLHVHRSLGSFRGDARLSTWLYRLTLNVTRMHLRKMGARPKLSLVGADEGHQLDGSSQNTPSVEAERNERERALRRAIDTLSEKKREALILHDFQGLAAEEIARIVDAPIMTVRTRVFYARRELYERMAEEPCLADVAAEALASLQRRKANRADGGEAP